MPTHQVGVAARNLQAMNAIVTTARGGDKIADDTLILVPSQEQECESHACESFATIAERCRSKSKAPPEGSRRGLEIAWQGSTGGVLSYQVMPFNPATR